MFSTRNLWTSPLLPGAAICLWLAGLACALLWSESVLRYPIWLCAIQAVLVLVLFFQINNTVQHYGLTANLCYFPAVFFLLAMAGGTPLYFSPAAPAAAILCLSGYRQLFVCYMKNDCNVQTFSAFFLLATASLLVPPLLWAIPVMWVAYNLVNNLNIQRFLSSIAGIAMLAWMVWGISFLADAVPIIADKLESLIDDFVLFGSFQSGESVYGTVWSRIALGVYVLMAVISFISFHHGRARRHSVRSYTLLLHVVWWCLMVLMLCYPSYSIQLLMLSFVPFAISAGQFYFERDTLFTRILFCLWLASIVMLYVNGDGPSFPA